MAVSNLGKILEVIEEMLNVVPLIRKDNLTLSEQNAAMDSRVWNLREKIRKLKEEVE